jgi:hypothetical protein
MSPLFWDWGVCYRRAKLTNIMLDGRIQPKLESVGVIEDWDILFVTEDYEDTLDTVISRIVQASGTSPEAFCSAIDRIYPKEEWKGIRMAGEQLKPLAEWDHPQRSDYDPGPIRSLLENWLALDWNSHVMDVPRREALRKIAAELTSLLTLECSQQQTDDTRIGDMWREMNWYWEMHGSELEGIARVRCKFCAGRFVYRLVCWEDPRPEAAQVYRIPGLLFDQTVPEGVCLVVSGTRIIGKMAYGAPACDCHRMESVCLG